MSKTNFEIVNESYRDFVSRVSTHKVLGQEHRIRWAIAELSAEAGEVQSLAAKAIRKDQLVDKEKLWDELGDVLWSLTACMNEAFPKKTFADLCEHNRSKLVERIKEQDATKQG